MGFKSARWLGLSAAVLLCGCTNGNGPALANFELTLAAQDSATAALERWCSTQRLADPARIAATLIHGKDTPPPPDLQALLQTAPAEAVGYRHVDLSCGSRVLSVAHNWYVRGRLTPEMNAELDGSDIPFGKVAAPLRFIRERIATQQGRAKNCPRGTVLSQRALLRLPDGQPLSLVVECYTAANLAKGGS